MFFISKIMTILKKLNDLVRSGHRSSKANNVCCVSAEQETIEAQREIARGEGLSGDLRRIAKEFKKTY